MYKQVISSEKIPIKMWLQDIEDEALNQARNLANLPFVFHHIALMPDSHSGYGMPIGGVMATKNVVVPNAVGVDIGCGMMAFKTKYKVDDITVDDLKKFMGKIRSEIPVGFNHHHQKKNESFMPVITGDIPISKSCFNDARTYIGTLGGGNHFIEIQKGADGNVWVMIHSGSRNLGKQVADHYNDIAIELNTRWFSSVDKSKQLAFLPMETEEGQMYFNEMKYCVDFSYANRDMMKNVICEIMETEAFDVINIAHNYASMEHHFGHNVLVHRKGATRAKDGELGIIPGSQGSKSYIVKGLGNVESFCSCSHGAGRKMSRTKAQNELNLETEIKNMEDQGIIHGIRTKKDLDESAGAYKDINVVMKNQEDLVDIYIELKPMAIIKG